MGGHLDDAELTKLPPIVSISLGNAAIFLIGGRTRDTKPAAVWLRSGDIASMSTLHHICFPSNDTSTHHCWVGLIWFVVMGGESRLCYHAVPRIVADTLPDALKAVAASPEVATPMFSEQLIASLIGYIN
jgi:alkylated DNA repair dioxygenase AlkB